MWRNDKSRQVGKPGIFFSDSVHVVPQNQQGSGNPKETETMHAAHSVQIVPRSLGGTGKPSDTSPQTSRSVHIVPQNQGGGSNVQGNPQVDKKSLRP